MKKIKLEYKPFFSVLIVIASLITIVFLKMEMRRMGYLVLKENNKLFRMEDHLQLKKMQYERVISPERIRKIAVSQLTLGEVKTGQIIQISGEKIALIQ